MNFFLHTLRHYPEIAIFLTLAIGFSFGSLKFKGFSLGAVTSTLIAGLIVGQLKITVAPLLESVFFMMFLFSVGYSVGPQFFRALKHDGLGQIGFAVVLAVSGLLSAWVLGRLLGYNSGLTAGLLSGGFTNSGTLGVAEGFFGQAGLGPEEAKRMGDLAAIAYAVTYPFGTVGAAWFLTTIAPKILKVDLHTAAKELEESMGYKQAQPGVRSAYQVVEARAFRLENHEFVGRKARDLPTALGAPDVYVTRVRQTGGIRDADARTIIEQGATVVVVGKPPALLAAEKKLGPEVDDAELVGYPLEELDVVVTRKDMVDHTLAQFEAAVLGRVGRGLFVLRLTRGGKAIQPSPDLKVQHRDVLTLLGFRTAIDDAAAQLGYADRQNAKSDIATMALAVVVGGFVGAVSIKIGGIPVGLSTSVGVLLAGLVCGYLRSTYRTFGRIPEPALWILNNVGLNGFIAVVGLNAAGGLVSGLKTYGLGLFGAGIVVSLVPLLVGVFAGKYIFKFNPVITLGACAGGRSTTAALGALQEAAQSPVPAVGYTIPYAVGRIIMAIFGVIIVLMMR